MITVFLLDWPWCLPPVCSFSNTKWRNFCTKKRVIFPGLMMCGMILVVAWALYIKNKSFSLLSVVWYRPSTINVATNNLWSSGNLSRVHFRCMSERIIHSDIELRHAKRDTEQERHRQRMGIIIYPEDSSRRFQQRVIDFYDACSGGICLA